MLAKKNFKIITTFCEEDIRTDFNCKNVNRTNFNRNNVSRTKIFTNKQYKKISHYKKQTKDKDHKIQTLLHSAVLMVMSAGDLQNVWNFAIAKKEKAAYLTKFGTERGINCVPTQLEKFQQHTMLPWSSLKNSVNSQEIIFSKSLAIDTGPKISQILPINKYLPQIDATNITTIQEEIDFIHYFRKYFHSFLEVKQSLLQHDFFSFYPNLSRYATVRTQFFTLIKNNRFPTISSNHGSFEKIKNQITLCNKAYKEVILPCLHSDFRLKPKFTANFLKSTAKPYDLVYLHHMPPPSKIPSSTLTEIPHLLSIPSSPPITSLGFASLDFFTLLPF